MVKGHFKSASNMTKRNWKQSLKKIESNDERKRTSINETTVQIIEFLEAQSTTIKKLERSACETKLLKREKVPADTSRERVPDFCDAINKWKFCGVDFAHVWPYIESMTTCHVIMREFNAIQKVGFGKSV